MSLNFIALHYNNKFILLLCYFVAPRSQKNRIIIVVISEEAKHS